MGKYSWLLIVVFTPHEAVKSEIYSEFQVIYSSAFRWLWRWKSIFLNSEKRFSIPTYLPRCKFSVLGWCISGVKKNCYQLKTWKCGWWCCIWKLTQQRNQADSQSDIFVDYNLARATGKAFEHRLPIWNPPHLRKISELPREVFHENMTNTARRNAISW